MADQLGAAPKRTFKHVAVLMGGWSSEREISLKSGDRSVQKRWKAKATKSRLSMWVVILQRA